MNNPLTTGLAGTKIILPFPHEAVGICSPYNKGRKRPLSSVVFLCPSKIINKGLLPVKSFMVGCVRRLRSAVPLYGTANLIQSASNNFAVVRVGLQPYKGETAMRNHTQKPINYVSLKSIYLLLDCNKNLITSSLTIEQVKPLSEHIKGSIIKFQAMVRVEVLS